MRRVFAVVLLVLLLCVPAAAGTQLAASGHYSAGGMSGSPHDIVSAGDQSNIIVKAWGEEAGVYLAWNSEAGRYERSDGAGGFFYWRFTAPDDARQGHDPPAPLIPIHEDGNYTATP
jgi:hypothetical protein